MWKSEDVREEENWLLKLSSDFHMGSTYRCKNDFQELDTD